MLPWLAKLVAFLWRQHFGESDFTWTIFEYSGDSTLSSVISANFDKFFPSKSRHTSFNWKTRDIAFPGQRTWPMKVCNCKKLLSLWLEVNFLGDLLKVNFFIFPPTCFSLKCRINLGGFPLLNNRGTLGAHVTVSQREISNWKSGNIPEIVKQRKQPTGLLVYLHFLCQFL